MLLVDKALKYCNDVESGKEITTDEVKQQCKIFIDDYNINQYEDDFEFCFSEIKLKIINNLLKLFNYATGYVAGQQVLGGLEGFQALFLCAIFGWRYKNDLDKFRYRDVVLFIPRKNTKTFIIALVLLLLMLTEQDLSEFYSICVDRDLATEVRKAMDQIISASPLIKKHFFVSESKTGIIKCLITKSFYYPRTSKANKNNAIRPCACCVDEVGAFTDNKNIQAMRKGQLNVKNPLMMKITTAYAESDSIMLEELDYDRAVLDGNIDNKRLFALLYYCTREEAWTDDGLYKSNPLRVEENYKEIREDRETAKVKTSEQEEYLTKNMNIFLETNEINKYIDMKYWNMYCVDKVDFEGQEVVIGVDMSVTTDLTAVGIMYREGIKLKCKSHGFLPRESLGKRRENINYEEMERQGYCDIHDGMTINYTKVEEHIRGIEEKYNCKIKCIVTDPTNAKEMIERLGADYDVILRKQTYTELSPATKEFRKKIYDGEVEHEKNGLLDWNARNATTTKGKSDDEMLAKEDKHKQRIDMIVVLVFCFTELFEIEEYNPMDALEEMSKNWG